jgi:hypothetical protein
MIEVDTFKRHILEGDVLDSEGTHHEFANYGHGRKLDFDVIPDDTPLCEEWADLNAQAIRQRGGLVLAVLGVANGTNRLSREVGSRLGVKSLYTEKISPRAVRITAASRKWLIDRAGENGLVIALEDVGTTGGTALTAIEDAQTVGVAKVEGQFTWQRTDTLPAFDAAGVAYHAIIHEPLATYKADQCIAEGYCAEGWVLIPHSQQ